MVFVIVKDLTEQGGEKNMRLCNDNHWRGWCHDGTTGDCVKVYHKRAWADRKAKRVKGTVVEIQNGQAMNVAGQIQYVDH